MNLKPLRNGFIFWYILDSCSKWQSRPNIKVYFCPEYFFDIYLRRFGWRVRAFRSPRCLIKKNVLDQTKIQRTIEIYFCRHCIFWYQYFNLFLIRNNFILIPHSSLSIAERFPYQWHASLGKCYCMYGTLGYLCRFQMYRPNKSQTPIDLGFNQMYQNRSKLNN